VCVCMCVCVYDRAVRWCARGTVLTVRPLRYVVCCVCMLYLCFYVCCILYVCMLNVFNPPSLYYIMY
jgi:hypothetical protein